MFSFPTKSKLKQLNLVNTWTRQKHVYFDCMDNGSVTKYYHRGSKHCINRPDICLTDSISQVVWWFKGECHRIDGPAIITHFWVTGNRVEEWYYGNKEYKQIIPENEGYSVPINAYSKLHRNDGPALKTFNRLGDITYRQWYIFGDIKGFKI